MGKANFQGYLALLWELNGTLASLTEIEKAKTQAVREDDLAALNECMKQEQVLGLALRGIDQKREAAISALALDGISLSGLVERAPEEYKDEASRLVEELGRQYQLFHGASEVARNTLECNLHQVEKILEEMGGGVEGGAGYQDGEPELPRKMRTDIRA